MSQASKLVVKLLLWGFANLLFHAYATGIILLCEVGAPHCCGSQLGVSLAEKIGTNYDYPVTL